LTVWAAIHGVHVSLLKRMSARDLDVTKREVVLAWIRENGRETTRFGLKEEELPPKVKPPKPPDAPSTPKPAPQPITPIGAAERRRRRLAEKGWKVDGDLKL
jgi:hypothetical protein